MPVSTIILLSLNATIPKFVTTLYKTSLEPLVIAKVVRWIITPSTLSTAALLHLSQPWDILLILPGASHLLPEALQDMIKDQWSIQAGIPSRLIASFETANEKLLHPSSEDIPPLTGALSHPRIASSSQALELSDELRQWISCSKSPKGAVSMLNLLAFQAGRKEEYLKYGKAFAESIGSSRGGVAKIVGKVVPGTCSDGCQEWEEVALAHYPSLEHFADMIASEDYQDVNRMYRIPSLRDTCILCTTVLSMSRFETTFGGLLENFKLSRLKDRRAMSVRTFFVVDIPPLSARSHPDIAELTHLEGFWEQSARSTSPQGDGERLCDGNESRVSDDLYNVGKAAKDYFRDLACRARCRAWIMATSDDKAVAKDTRI